MNWLGGGMDTLFVVNGLNKKHLQVSKDFFIPGDEIIFYVNSSLFG